MINDFAIAFLERTDENSKYFKCNNFYFDSIIKIIKNTFAFIICGNSSIAFQLENFKRSY
jgi:hypothetical protein